MRDALSATVDYVKAEGKRDKKVVVMVTDGRHNRPGLVEDVELPVGHVPTDRHRHRPERPGRHDDMD